LSGVEGDPQGAGERQPPISESSARERRAGERPSHPPVAAAVLVLSVFALLVLLAVVSTL
jgi:hypothetical protein